jgi:hypothetical protein
MKKSLKLLSACVAAIIILMSGALQVFAEVPVSGEGTSGVDIYLPGVTELDGYNVTVIGRGGSYYDEVYDVEPVIKGDTNGTTVSIGGFDWTSYDMYYAWILTDTHYLKVEIAQSDEGSTFTLDADNAPEGEYVPFNVDIEGTGSDLVIDIVNLTYIVSDGGKMSVGGIWNEGIKIPAGNYNLQVNAHDTNNVYSLFKIGCSITNPENNTISFASASMAKVSAILFDTHEYGLSLSSLIPLNDNFNTIYHARRRNDKDSFMITKLSYSDLRFEYKDLQGNRVIYSAQSGEVVSDRQLEFDTDFKAIIEFNQTEYGAGEDLRFIRASDYYDSLGVVDSRGSWVGISDPEYDSYHGSLVFTCGGNSFTYNVDDLVYPSKINLPSVEGIYSVDFSVSSPFAVTSATAGVVIGTGTSQQLQGDCNNDGSVGLYDLAILSLSLGSSDGSAGWDSRADLNMDSRVDIADFDIMRSNYGNNAFPVLSPARLSAPEADAFEEGTPYILVTPDGKKVTSY